MKKRFNQNQKENIMQNFFSHLDEISKELFTLVATN